MHVKPPPRRRISDSMRQFGFFTVGAQSKIEWTESTWNPVRGCVKISPGCKHCYAETFAERFRGVAGHPYEAGFDPRLVPNKLAEPLSWPTARMVFVNSMSDLFQDDVPDDYIAAVARVMSSAPWHTYQVLTKRAERMAQLLAGRLRDVATLPHIWWGVSVEDRFYGIPRIDQLRAAPAGVRFLSVEPLLEDVGQLDLRKIDWVIVGGESGPGARPMRQEWVESIFEQCRQSDIPFFFKQWGGFPKSKAGRSLHGRTYDAFPLRQSHLPVPSKATRSSLVREIGLERWLPTPDTKNS